MTAIEKSSSPSETIKTIYELLNKHDLEAFSKFLAEDVDEYWSHVGRLQGAAAVLDHFAALFAAFPDFRMKVERMAADGETVFVHWTGTGHFSGAPFFGLLATGRAIEMRGIDCMTIRDGKVTSNIVVYDALSIVIQGGVLPVPGSRMDRFLTHMMNLRTRMTRLFRR